METPAKQTTISYNLPTMMLAVLFTCEEGYSPKATRDGTVGELMDYLESKKVIYRPNPANDFRQADDGTQPAIAQAVDSWLESLKWEAEKSETADFVKWVTMAVGETMEIKLSIK